MTRPSKFETMRRNRRAGRIAQLRAEAMALGYDEEEAYFSLAEHAARELQAMREPAPSITFGRKPRRRSLLQRMFDWALGPR